MCSLVTGLENSQYKGIIRYFLFIFRLISYEIFFNNSCSFLCLLLFHTSDMYVVVQNEFQVEVFSTYFDCQFALSPYPNHKRETEM